jgi:hypothetical protein
VIDDLDIDDSDSPAIGLVPPGVSRDDVRDHVKIGHGPVLVPGADGGDCSGAYWAGTEVVVADGLSPDLDEAVSEFRALLRDAGEA